MEPMTDLPDGLDPEVWTESEKEGPCTHSDCLYPVKWTAPNPFGGGRVHYCTKHARIWQKSQFDWVNEHVREIIKKAKRRYGH